MVRILALPRLIVWLLALPVYFGSASLASCQTLTALPINIGTAFADAGAAATDLRYGKEANIFEKNGLNVTITPINTSAALVPALLSGTIDIGQGSASNIATALLKGVGLIYIGVSQDKYNVQLWATADIKSPQDLIGKKVAVTAVGSETDQALTLFLAQNNLVGKVERLNSGDVAGMTSAFYSGAAQAAVAQPPNSLKFATRGKGYHLLADFSNDPYISSAFVTTVAYAKSHPDVIARFLMAEDAVLIAIRTDPQSVTALIEKYNGLSPNLASQTYDFFSRVFAKDITVSPRLLTKILQDAASDSSVPPPSDVTKFIYKPIPKSVGSN